MAEFLDVWALHLAVTGNEETAELTALKDDLAQMRSSLAKARADLVDATDQGDVMQQLTHALADLDEANESLVNKDVENLKLKAKIADLVLEKGRTRSRPGPGGDPSDSSDNSDTPDRDRNRTRDLSREREDTPGSRFSQSGRSAKMADPPVFYNEKSKDTVVFASWLRQVKNKLRVNSDHFLSDDAKMAYIEGRLGGKASEDLEPYINETHCEPIMEELLKHLFNEYNDHQAADKAIEAFNALDLKVGGDFSAFKNSFVRLAGERGLKRAEWKGEFKRRLPASLQVALAGAYLDKNVDFESYARLAPTSPFPTSKPTPSVTRRRRPRLTRTVRAPERIPLLHPAAADDPAERPRRPRRPQPNRLPPPLRHLAGRSSLETTPRSTSARVVASPVTRPVTRERIVPTRLLARPASTRSQRR